MTNTNTDANNFTVQYDGLTMDCRVVFRSGGYHSGHVSLVGYVAHEERMSCDVTLTYRRYRDNPERFRIQMRETAFDRLVKIRRGN